MKLYVVHIAMGMGVALVALSCAGHSSASKPAAAETTVTQKGEIAPATTDFEGTIGRIDIEKGMVTVEHWPLSKTFKVPPECEIYLPTNATASATLAQLKVEDPVVVTYTEVGKDLVASRIARRGKAYEQERNEKLERLDEMLNPSPNQ